MKMLEKYSFSNSTSQLEILPPTAVASIRY